MAHPVDIHVGKVLRATRAARGLSQEKLANRLGISFQQIQKYETGVNRIGSSRLWEISEVLGVPVGHFFQDLDAEVPVGDDPLPPRTLERARQIDAIPDSRVRSQVLKLIKACASEG
jgi:transcriptional regulator with XRE-family HTH domain